MRSNESQPVEVGSVVLIFKRVGVLPTVLVGAGRLKAAAPPTQHANKKAKMFILIVKRKVRLQDTNSLGSLLAELIQVRQANSTNTKKTSSQKSDACFVDGESRKIGFDDCCDVRMRETWE